MKESLSLPGFERSLPYTGEEKGGLDPQEEDDLLRRPLPLLYYLFSLKEHTNIPHTPSLNSNKPSMTIPSQPKQVKSHWYYIFWASATVAVVLGQVYVATGYRELAKALTKAIWSIT